jgi:CHAT domain-containing protein
LLLDAQQQKQTQTPLIEKYKVVYSSSASLLQFHKPKKDKIQTCKAFGVALNEYEHEFELEAKRVATLFETVPKLDVTRQEIIDTRFTEDILHFSCHGYFYPDDPLASGLVLKNEEYLTARDIFANNLKIDSQLVTLSACETGVSENRKGDELIGLARSFLYSGAQSLVMSLWKVNAQAALEIMEEFYNNIKNSEDSHDKASALQKAQLTIKNKWKENGRTYDHPFIWAPFVLVGDWR